MKIWWLLVLAVLCAPLVGEAAFCLQHKWAKARPGDYVVMEQEGHYSVLVLRLCAADKMVIEEIVVPENGLNLKKMSWKEWVAGQAPGHTAWLRYTLSSTSGKLLSCFSLTKQGWVSFSPQEEVLARLLSLPLQPLPEAERKRIGPPPQGADPDRRALWTPPVVVEGKKQPRSPCSVFRGQWPQEDKESPLAGCSVDLYFATSLPDFPFPLWVEVHSPHYTFRARAVDSGSSL
jgi:hypothetical protein